jgi:hypothetical protein
MKADRQLAFAGVDGSRAARTAKRSAQLALAVTAEERSCAIPHSPW